MSAGREKRKKREGRETERKRKRNVREKEEKEKRRACQKEKIRRGHRNIYIERERKTENLDSPGSIWAPVDDVSHDEAYVVQHLLHREGCLAHLDAAGERRGRLR